MISDFFATLNFLREWWWIILIGVGVVVLIPSVLPMLIRFFTETVAGRYIALAFLAVGGAFFAFLSAFNAGRASAYRDKVVQQTRLKAPPPPAKKKPPNWFGRN